MVSTPPLPGVAAWTSVVPRRRRCTAAAGVHRRGRSARAPRRDRRGARRNGRARAHHRAALRPVRRASDRAPGRGRGHGPRAALLAIGLHEHAQPSASHHGARSSRPSCRSAHRGSATWQVSSRRACGTNFPFSPALPRPSGCGSAQTGLLRCEVTVRRIAAHPRGRGRRRGLLALAVFKRGSYINVLVVAEPPLLVLAVRGLERRRGGGWQRPASRRCSSSSPCRG